MMHEMFKDCYNLLYLGKAFRSPFQTDGEVYKESEFELRPDEAETEFNMADVKTWSFLRMLAFRPSSCTYCATYLIYVWLLLKLKQILKFLTPVIQ